MYGKHVPKYKWLQVRKIYYGKNNVDIYESPNAAADCARFINPTLIFIVSQVAIYTLLPQLFYFVGFYILRVHLPSPCSSSEGGSFFYIFKTKALFFTSFRISLLCSLNLMSIPLAVSPTCFCHKSHSQLTVTVIKVIGYILS